MDHNYAIENHVAEGYLLADLDEAERDAYEDHYFGCTKCAEEVEMVSEFMDTAKQLIREEPKRQPVPISAPSANWFRRITAPIMQPLPAALCALLVMTSGVMVYQRILISQPPEVSVISSAATRIALTSAHAAQEVTTLKKGQAIALRFTVPPSLVEQHFDSYRADLVTDSGVVKCSAAISQQDTNDPVDMGLPRSKVESGKYFLVIYGVNSNQTESGIKGDSVRIPFELKLQ